jgi:carbonic anhydrase
MTKLDEILTHNARFVANKEYEQYRTDRFPHRGLVILTCMDTRLLELLPKALGVGNGDVKIIKNAGAIVSHPFGSIMRSILVAVYELHATEVCVIGHHECGMTGLSCARIIEKARQRGISDDTLNTLQNSGIDLPQWLTGFTTVEVGVKQSVAMIRNHPLLPRDVAVHGAIIHPTTGQLDVLVEGYSHLPR